MATEEDTFNRLCRSSIKDLHMELSSQYWLGDYRQWTVYLHGTTAKEILEKHNWSLKDYIKVYSEYTERLYKGI